MAEAFAIVGFVSAIWSLADYGSKVVTRLNDFRRDVKELPPSFLHIIVQLPLLVDIVHRLHDQANQGELSHKTEKLLRPVVEGLHGEIEKLDAVLRKMLPSVTAGNWEKGVKAIKSVGAQKDVDGFAAVIRDYVSNLTAFQTTHNSDLIRKLGTRLEDQKQIASPIKPPLVRPPIWLNKYDSDADFVGRDNTMTVIERQLKSKNHRVALAGIGGVGKSRIAIQYCYQFRQQYPETHILWVFGGTKPRFETDYQRIAMQLNIPGHEDSEFDKLRLVFDWLSDQKSGPWLMVLDSADDHELWLGSVRRESSSGKSSMPLIDYIPRCDHGGIIVTTRDSQLAYRLLEGKQDPLMITRFQPEEARILLSAKLSEDKNLSLEDADELTRALEYLPLTITQAAAYLKQIDISASEYLELFRKGETDIPNLLADSIDDPGRDRETSNSIFQTWKVSFDQILKQSHAAADLLSLTAVLDRQSMSKELLQRPDESLLEFKAAVSKLKAFSLISEENSSSSKYSVHRLVQVSTQRWLEHYGTLSIWQEAALAAVARQCPKNLDYALWPLVQELYSHAQLVLTYSITKKTCHVDRATILHCLGHYYMDQGHNTLALKMLSKCHEYRKENLEPDHEDTLTTLGLLGVAYSKLDYWQEAYELQVGCWETTERALGPNHRLTLKSKSRLAITYNKGGDSSRAEEIQLEALEAMERELGPEDKVTMTEMSNLVYTYNKQRKWEQAERLGLRTLALRTEVLGPTHPDTLTTMTHLGWTYRALARWEEADELARKSLEHRIEALGPGHPKTLLAMSIMARNLCRQGSWSEAEHLQRQVLEGLQRVRGPTHHETIRAEEFLAEIVTAKEGNGMLRPSAASERRPRSGPSRSVDSYQPYGRRRSRGSLSPSDFGGDYREPRRRSSPYNGRKRDWEHSSNWRQR